MSTYSSRASSPERAPHAHAVVQPWANMSTNQRVEWLCGAVYHMGTVVANIDRRVLTTRDLSHTSQQEIMHLRDQVALLRNEVDTLTQSTPNPIGTGAAGGSSSSHTTYAP